MKKCIMYLAIQLPHNISPVADMLALIVDSQAGGDIASQPVQAGIGDHEVHAERHFPVGLPSI